MAAPLPGAAVSLALHLYKGYHFLLMARAGERDLAVIDHRHQFNTGLLK